MIPKPKEF